MSPSQMSRKWNDNDDLYVLTLRDYVEALGGRLEIRAVFPDQTVSLAVPMTERHEEEERLEGLH